MPFDKTTQRPLIVSRIFTQAKQNKQRIVFAESEDERILRGTSYLANKKIIQPVLIGNKKKILAKLTKLKIPKKLYEIHDMSEVPDYTKKLLTLRKKKGLTIEQAKKLLTQPIYVATMMVKTNFCDGLVYGATHPTAETLRPALQIIGMKKGVKWASSYFIMLHEKKVLFFADCAFNINPNEEQLRDIAIATANSAKEFGFKPKVAMLSFSTMGSGQSELVTKVQNATELVRKMRPDIIIGGELQFDAAFVPSVAKLKAPNSPIKGDANIFVFPDLNSGNIGYKIAQRLANDKPIGPITQGLALPVNDLSRGCTVEEVIEVSALTAVQAIRFKEIASGTLK